METLKKEIIERINQINDVNKLKTILRFISHLKANKTPN